MVRPLRIHFAGAIYHVTFRGNERRAIFRDDRDRERMLAVLEEASAVYRVRMYLVCLMSNHVHLLLETPRANLSDFMGALLTGYTVWFNRRHRRHGHLTQGRYKAQLVEGNEYLLNLSRYIHLNPVHTNQQRRQGVSERLAHLRAWRWSTYRGYTGLQAPWSWIDYEPILALTALPQGADRKAGYARFVETGMAETDAEFRALYQDARLAIGSDDFRREVERAHTRAGQGARRREDVSLRRELDRIPVDRVLETVAATFGETVEAITRRRRGSLARAAACWHLRDASGLSQREIAERMDLSSGAAVGYQLGLWQAARTGMPGAKSEKEICRKLHDEATSTYFKS